MHGLVPYKGDKRDKNAARPPEGSLVETRCLIIGPKSAIVPFPGPRSGPKSRTGPGALVRYLQSKSTLLFNNFVPKSNQYHVINF